jgi:SAM-dependent methyltransferase
VAIWQARCKAWRAGVDCTFHRADVTDLSFLDGTFDFVLDIGCLHSISMEGWGRYASGIARAARPGGLYMLYAFAPHPDWPGPRGISPDEVRDLFAPAFAVERQEGGDDPTGPSSAWYWLRRVGAL